MLSIIEAAVPSLPLPTSGSAQFINILSFNHCYFNKKTFSNVEYMFS